MSVIDKTIRSSIGFLLGQGIYTVFLILIAKILPNKSNIEFFIDFLVFSRTCAIISLLGYEKYVLISKTGDSNFNVFYSIKKNSFFLTINFLLLISLSLLFNYFIFNKDFTFVLVFSFVAFLFSVNEIFVYYLRGNKKYLLNLFFQYGCFVLFFFPLYYLTYNVVLSVVLAMLVVTSINIIFNYYEKSSLGFTDEKKINYKFGVSVTLGVLVSLLLNGSDLFFYKLFNNRGSYDYMLLSRVSMLVGVPLVVMNNHFVVDIGQYLKVNKEKFKESYRNNRLFSFLGTLLLSVILLVFTKLFENYIELTYITIEEFNLFLIIMLVSKNLSSVVGGVNNILMLGGKEKVFLTNSLIVFFVSLVLYPFLISHYNFLGLVLANSFLLIMINCINRFSVKKGFNV